MEDVDTAVAAAEERTLQRVAQALHDDLQQHLHSLRVRIGLIESELERGGRVDPAVVVELGRRADEAVEALRSITGRLAAPARMDDLAAALSELAGRTSDLHALEIDVHYEGHAGPFAPKMIEVLCDAASELLFNVVKHAGVDRAEVNVHAGDAAVVLVVADAGLPSELADPVPTGLGIDLLRTRLSDLGGTLQLDSRLTGGTVATVRIPSGPLLSEHRDADQSGETAALT